MRWVRVSETEEPAITPVYSTRDGIRCAAPRPLQATRVCRLGRWARAFDGNDCDLCKQHLYHPTRVERIDKKLAGG